MSAVKPEYVKSGEYKFAHEQKKEAPITALIAENLGPDIVISICNIEAKAVVLARQVDLESLPKIVDKLLGPSPSGKKPQKLMVSFIGGKGSSSDEERSQQNNPGYQYFLKALSTLKECAGTEAKHYIASAEPYVPEVKIEGSRAVFSVIEANILGKPHPESIYLMAKGLQPREYTEKTKKAFLFCATPPALAPSLLPSVSLKTKIADSGYIQVNKKRHMENEEPVLRNEQMKKFQPFGKSSTEH